MCWCYLYILKWCVLDVECCCYSVKSHLGQTLMVQVAKRGASVLKRRKSRNRMEAPSANATTASGGGTSPVTASAGGGTNTGLQHQHSTNDASGSGLVPLRSESDGDVVFYVEDPRAGKFTRNRIIQFLSFHCIVFISTQTQNSHIHTCNFERTGL